MEEKKTEEGLERLYVEVDALKYEEEGEVVVIGNPGAIEDIARDEGIVYNTMWQMCHREGIGYMLRLIGGGKGKVVDYLVRRLDLNNKIQCTMKELSAACGVAYNTVKCFIDDAEGADLLVYHNGVIMMNPVVIFTGKIGRSYYLSLMYDNIKKRKHRNNLK